MRVRLLGASGLLGTYLASHLGQTATQRVEITQPHALRHYVSGADVVINCAAWTAVDAAESHEPAARLINAVAVHDLTDTCRKNGIWLFHMSTDFVFSGDSHHAYGEGEPVWPLSAYGRTKAEGEVAVLNYERGTVVRTAWLHAGPQRGFVAAVLSRARAGVPFSVVDDQHGQPTFADDAAGRILQIIQRVVARRAPAGVWHVTNSGTTSRWQFARTALSITGADPDLVTPVATRIDPGIARRPRSASLADTRGDIYNLPPMRSWRDALIAALPVVNGTP